MDGDHAQGSFSPQLLEPPHVQLLKSSAASWTVSSGITHQMPHSILSLSTAIPCPVLDIQSQCVSRWQVTSIIKTLENRKCRGKLKRMWCFKLRKGEDEINLHIYKKLLQSRASSVWWEVRKESGRLLWQLMRICLGQKSVKTLSGQGWPFTAAVFKSRQYTLQLALCFGPLDLPLDLISSFP